MTLKALILAFLGFAFSANAFAAETPWEKALNNGQDITRPLARFDTSYQYQTLQGNRTENFFTLRTDRPFVINDRWWIGTRVDLPCILTNKKTALDPEGPFKFGLGDVLTQFLLIRFFDERWAAAAGNQFIFPTAHTSQMGDGKYQLVPTAGVRRMLPELSNGSFTAFLVRYAVDYAGSSKRSRISTLELAPMFNWNLPREWFVNAFPSTDFQINLADKGHVFIPFDIMIGKTIPNKAIFSVEAAFPMYYSGEPENFYTFYRFRVEARIGIFY